MMPLPPGSRIGILGGGQLGRMLALAAAPFGFDVHIFTDEADSPASRVAAHTVVASYGDGAALRRFAEGLSVCTYEFENVPVTAVETLLAEGVPVAPGAAALAVAQDRAAEKAFLAGLGAQTAAYGLIDGPEDAAAALASVGLPAILKTRRQGYDGKGQVRLDRPEDLGPACTVLGNRDLILEGFCPFEREISVIAARGWDGQVLAFPVTENHHVGGILRWSQAPAPIAPDIAAQAEALTTAALVALDYVGVLAIEFFVMADGRLIANEMAPRVHNSGHWTEDACTTGQFTQAIRAVAGWSLGPVAPWQPARMENLIGLDATLWRKWEFDPAAKLHLYGKRAIRDGRKMGHVTVLHKD